MRLALLPLLLLAACGSAPEEGEDEASDQPEWAGPAEEEATGKLDRSSAGRTAPGAGFEDPDGAPSTLADFSGRPLLLNLWATWCAPCVAEMPTLDRLAERERDWLQVLTVSQDLDGRDRVEAFFRQQGYRNLETYLDPKMALMAELRVNTLPTTILYDSSGREVWRMTGMEDWEGGRAAALLAEAMSEETSRGAAR